MYLSQEKYEKLTREVKKRSDESNIWNKGKRKAKYRSFEFLTLEQCNEYCEIYLSENMKGLKEVVNKVINKQSKKKGRSYSDNEKFELRDLGYEVFVMSLGTYNPNAKCTFKTFFYGNLSRKFYSYGRDITRFSRCNWEPVIDEKTNKYKRDKNGNIIKKPVFDISIYSVHSKNDGNKELWEFLETDKSIEDDVFGEEIEDTVEQFLNNISRNARKVATYIMNGYTRDEMSQMGINNSLYRDAINEFKTFDNVHILLGGKINGKNR